MEALPEIINNLDKLLESYKSVPEIPKELTDRVYEICKREFENYLNFFVDVLELGVKLSKEPGDYHHWLHNPAPYFEIVYELHKRSDRIQEEYKEAVKKLSEFTLYGKTSFQDMFQKEIFEKLNEEYGSDWHTRFGPVTDLNFGLSHFKLELAFLGFQLQNTDYKIGYTIKKNIIAIKQIKAFDKSRYSEFATGIAERTINEFVKVTVSDHTEQFRNVEDEHGELYEFSHEYMKSEKIPLESNQRLKITVHRWKFPIEDTFSEEYKREYNEKIVRPLIQEGIELPSSGLLGIYGILFGRGGNTTADLKRKLLRTKEILENHFEYVEPILNL